jgi:hypothetical protein
MRRLLLGLAVAASTLVPGVVSADDTQIADFIQTRLQAEQQQGRLKGFNVDMQVEQGTVWFKGTVSNEQQEMLILQTAQQAGHLGVVQVVDDIEVKMAQVKPVAYQQPAPMIAAPAQPTAATPASYAPAPIAQEVMSGSVVTGEPLPFASCGGGSAPGGAMGGAMGAPSGAPNLPGYAWPGYAAHPNYGAVSYPRQYSASAWPYIGPFYPYPQVPLGWRKVSLEWDDGFWHLDFSDKTRH